MTEPGEAVSLTDYVSRMKEGQTAIYYQVARSRSAIESGPYAWLSRHVALRCSTCSSRSTGTW